MKTKNLIYIIFFYYLNTYTQDNISFPNLDVFKYDKEILSNKPDNIFNFFNDNKINIVTIIMGLDSCRPCREEVENIYNNINTFKLENEVNYSVIVSLPDDNSTLANNPIYTRNVNFIKSKNWKIPLYFDVGNFYLKSISYNSAPKTFVVDKNGIVHYNSKSKSSDSQLKELFEEVNKVVNFSDIEKNKKMH